VIKRGVGKRIIKIVFPIARYWRHDEEGEENCKKKDFFIKYGHGVSDINDFSCCESLYFKIV